MDGAELPDAERDDDQGVGVGYVDDPWPRRCEIAGAAIIGGVVVQTAIAAWAAWSQFGTRNSLVPRSADFVQHLRYIENAITPSSVLLLMVGVVVMVVDAVATGRPDSRSSLATRVIQITGVIGVLLTVALIAAALDLAINKPDDVPFFFRNQTIAQRILVAALSAGLVWLTIEVLSDPTDEEIDAIATEFEIGP